LTKYDFKITPPRIFQTNRQNISALLLPCMRAVLPSTRSLLPLTRDMSPCLARRRRWGCAARLRREEGQLGDAGGHVGGLVHAGLARHPAQHRLGHARRRVCLRARAALLTPWRPRQGHTHRTNLSGPGMSAALRAPWSMQVGTSFTAVVLLCLQHKCSVTGKLSTHSCVQSASR